MNDVRPDVANLATRATSVLRGEMNASLKALDRPAPPTATPQVQDFASRFKSDVDQGLLQVGAALVSTVNNLVVQLLNLAPMSGLTLASVPAPIKVGQTGTGTFGLANRGTNPVTGLNLVASELRTFSGSTDTIPESDIKFAPATISIAPNGSTTVTVHVTAPANQAAGKYYGSFLNAATGQVLGLLSVEVTT
jgi:hypothetical protein